MRKSALLIALLSFSCSAEHSASRSIAGKWLLKDATGHSSPLECPDLLTLRENGRYSVSNDCYGDDIRGPVTETGDWLYAGGKELILKNRRFQGNYFLLGNSSGSLDVEVLELSETELVLRIGSNDKEVYVKVER